MPLDNCPFLKTAHFQSLFSMWLWLPNEEGRERGERKLIYVRHVFVGFVEGEESGIRNPEFGIRNRFLLLFLENHLAFAIFFCISFSFVCIIEY